MERKELPKTVLIAAEARDLDGELRADIRLLQNAYTTLRDMEDYDCPTTLEELNTKEIERLTKERVSRAMEDATLLPSEVNERVAKYRALRRAVVTQIHIIEKVAARWPQAKFAYDPQVLNITPTADLTAIVEAQCTKPVPPMAQQHARLIGNVLEAITKLRQFEQEENVCKMRLEVLAAMDENAFAAHWADGSIKRPTYTNDPWMQRAAVGREFAERQYL